MKFGMLLLLIILAFSLVGSVVVQGAAESVYARDYPGAYHLIMALGFDHIFSTWYFLTAMALLCGNLTLCNIVRIGKVRKLAAKQLESAATAPISRTLDGAQREKLLNYLESRHFKMSDMDGTPVYGKNRVGYYGSFATHLAILLVFVVGALALYLADTKDYTVMPKESVTLEDGTELFVNSFRITDGEGKLDFTSIITITAPDGVVDGPAEISVNYPHAFRSHKFYQQTYGTCGSVTVTDTETGGQDVFTLDEVSFLSADGVNGIWYQALYPGYVRDEQGNFTLITSTAGEYEDPVYEVVVRYEGSATPVLAFPGEELTLGTLIFTFNEPVSYPGIRVKTTPPVVTALLYAAFVLMILGLWLCFFQTPIAVALRDEGYAISGPKTTGLKLELDALLGENENNSEETQC